MTSGRVVELCHTFQDHILDALGSSMALRDNGSNTLCDDQAFLPILLVATLSAVPRSCSARGLPSGRRRVRSAKWRGKSLMSLSHRIDKDSIKIRLLAIFAEYCT